MPDSSASIHTTATSSPVRARRLPVGAEYQGDGRSDLRVWAPAVLAHKVRAVLDDPAADGAA